MRDGGKTFLLYRPRRQDGARADYGDGRAEDFAWDGLALVRRGDERFVNEPHPGGGSPVLSSEGVAYLNDLLGTTVGTWGGRAVQKRKEKRRYSAAALTAFGEPPPGAEGGASAVPSPFFTGKPDVPGLGRVFLFRNYRPGLAKWQTADPIGYPDGWNALAYCGNEVTSAVDLFGCLTREEMEAENRRCQEQQNQIRTNAGGLTLQWKEILRGVGLKSDERESNAEYTEWRPLDAEYDFRFKNWTASWLTYDYREVLFVVPKGKMDLFIDDMEKLTYFHYHPIRA